MYLLSHTLGFFFVWRKCQILQKSSHPHDSVQMSLPPGSSIIQSCLTLCDPMDCSTPGLSVHHQLPSLLKLMSIELVIPSKHLILCHPGGLPWTLPSLGSQSLLSSGVLAHHSALSVCLPIWGCRSCHGWTLESDPLRLNLGSAIYYLHDLEKLI